MSLTIFPLTYSMFFLGLEEPLRNFEKPPMAHNWQRGTTVGCMKKWGSQSHHFGGGARD